MTSRRRRERRAALRATFDEKLAAELARRPPKVVAGPARAFPISSRIEHAYDVGPDPRKQYSTHVLGPEPDHRSIALYLPPGLRYSARFADSSPFSHGVGEVVFRAVRMRAEWERYGHVARIDWWTWEPEDRSARVYRAVQTSKAICEALVAITRDLRDWGAVAHGTTDPYAIAAIGRLRMDAMRLHDYGETLAGAADEWLATPRKDAGPEREDRSRSRW